MKYARYTESGSKSLSSLESQIAAECMKYARYTSDEYALKCNPNIYMKIIRINMQILNKNMQNIENQS